MKKNKNDIIFWICVAVVAAMLSIAIASCESDNKDHHKTRTYELINKTTEVRTHRYMMIENAVETDHILVWKNEAGRTFSCEVSRDSYYHYEVGKRYRFEIDDRYSEQSQISTKCR